MLSNVFLYIHRVSHYRWLYWFFPTAKCTGRSFVFSTVFFTVRMITLSFLSEIWNINKPILKYACHYALGKRKPSIFFHYMNTNVCVSVLGIVGVCNIFTSLLCLIALPSPNPVLAYYSPKSDHRSVSFFPHLHLEHAGSDTFIVVRAPATLWPASQWFPLYYPPSISPCIALSSDSTEHHHQAHFSPNSTDNAGWASSILSFLSVCASQRIL